MIIFAIAASLISSFVISDISQANKCIAEESQTDYCKAKTAVRPSVFGDE